MTKRTLVVRRGSYCDWRPKIKRETNTKKEEVVGFMNPVFVVIMSVVMAGVFYLYAINGGASKGVEMRIVEKEITDLKNANEQLRIKEAELKSLYRVEEASKNLNMTILQNIDYVEDNGHVALVR